MANTHKVIYIAASVEQAHILKNALQEHGIFAYVTNDALQIAAGDLPHGQPTAPRVVVDEVDAEDAREIALAFDRAAQESALASHDEQADDEDALDTEEASRWPRCPHCGRPRHTSCPVCETAGTSFPQAFMPKEGDETGPDNAPRSLLVICPTCDEPFAPQFLARCEWCGHRFQDGRELPPPAPPAVSETNYRVWIVLAGLIIFVAATIVFFADAVSR
jgi:putative signal transducing protein